MSLARKEAFARFDSKLQIEYIKGRPSRNLSNYYSLFSVGSDQVWCARYMRDPGWYFLRFAPRSKRVALCPSIGVASVSNDDARLLRRGLAGFDELSVREEDGAALIRELTGREATVLVDPTLMLTAEEWRDVADGRLTPAEPYVFAYILGKEDPARDALIARLAAGRQVIRISDRDDGTELPAGPAEFIDLVDHAALVVTDSFHGSVFATLLATPLVEVPRAGGEHMAGRIDTLVSKLGLARVPVGEGDALAVPEGVPGGEGALVDASAGKKPADVAAPAEDAEAPAAPNVGAPATAAAPAAAAPAAPAEMTQGGASPTAASRADWLVPTPSTPELLAAERRKFASYLAGVLDSRGYPEQAARARAAWGVSSDDARAEGAGAAAGAAAAGTEGPHERLPREELR